MADPRIGDQFGRWTLAAPIDTRGGNAWVYRGTAAGETAALKILRRTKPESEPYKRFRREIATVQRLGDRPGILPVLDARIPDALAKGERAWFAMPEATRIDHALREADLGTVVGAIQSIADTLSALLVEEKLSHRDIKPQNLYQHGDSWVVGDFGLVTGPDADALTEPGAKVGPANFLAWEMLEDASRADAAAGDVYALAKTLWVLVADARWPPPGHQPADASTGVGAYRPHPNASTLDRVIDRATRLEPSARPSMREFADDLFAWLAIPKPSQGLTRLAEISEELRRRAAPHVAAEEVETARRSAAHSLQERFAERLARVNEAMAGMPNLDPSGEAHRLAGYLSSHPGLGEPEVVVRYGVGTTISQPAPLLPTKLRFGGVVELLDTGEVVLTAGIFLGNDEESGAELWVSEPRQLPAESVAAETAVDELVDEVERELPGWAERFLEHIS
jgi:hypothetical protein